jgi:hypothetical protein
MDENGNTVVRYGYDAWGAPLWCTGELAETLGKVQPFRRRRGCTICGVGTIIRGGDGLLMRISFYHAVCILIV